MTAQPVRSIEELDFPASAAIEDILEKLEPEAAVRFLRALLQAIEEARDTGDLRPIGRVITAWYRSLLFARQPGFADALVWAETLELTPDSGLTLEQALAELELPKPRP